MTDLAGKQVLHVDDDAVARELVARILEEQGIEVSEAHHGVEALQLLRERKVDMVLTDLQMPSMDGHDLIERIVSLYPDLPVIVLAAPATANDVLTAMRGHVHGYLNKPITEEALLRVVHDTLARVVIREGIQVISATEHWIELRFPSDEVYISRIREFFESLELGMDSSERGNLLYAFTELAQNAIEHGNRRDPDRHVTLAWYRVPGLRIFRVRDEGQGFNPLDLDHAVGFNPDRDPYEVMRLRLSQGIRPGGLGIASASRLADEMLYNERGNEVIMLKRVQGAD